MANVRTFYFTPQLRKFLLVMVVQRNRTVYNYIHLFIYLSNIYLPSIYNWLQKISLLDYDGWQDQICSVGQQAQEIIPYHG